MADNEKLEEFIYAKLKLKSYEIFKSFDEANQRELLATVDELISADGKVHPAEAKFRDEVTALLKGLGSRRWSGSPGTRRSADLTIAEPLQIPPKSDNHPFFAGFEQHYSVRSGTAAQAGGNRPLPHHAHHEPARRAARQERRRASWPE